MVNRPAEVWLLLAAALGLVLGIQLLRVFLALATFHLHDNLGLPPLATALISLVVFAVGLRAAALARRTGWGRALRWTAGLLAVTRVAEQVSASPAVDARVALVGTALLALLLPLLLLAVRESAAVRSRLAFAVLAGLGLETALRTLGGTLDLAWQEEPAADLVVAALATACLVAAIAAQQRRDPERPPTARPWAGAALGAWLALYLLVFSNPASLAARAGMPLERASRFVLGSWLLGLLLVGVLPLHGTSRWRTVEASALAAVGTWIAVFGGDDAWFGMVIGLPGMAVLLFDLLSGRSLGESGGIGPGGAGMVTLVLLYLAYGRFDQRFGPSETTVYLTAVGLLVAAVLTTAWQARADRPAAFWRLWIGGLVMAAGVGFAASRLLVPPDPAATARAAGPIRIMTYNLHQGFDVEGRLTPRALAEVIESQEPDLLALQEVTRGWLVTGGLDLYSWMRRRLGLAGRFGGTADPQWGNAVLTRLPVRHSALHSLPPEDLPLRRGVLEVIVATPSGDLRVLCLHLHHRRRDDRIRLRQTEALLRIWGGTPATVMLGDFNADAGSEVIGRLRGAGLHDASALLPPSGRATTTRLDGRQIDWIFATPDLAFDSTVTPYSSASDHLAVATSLTLTSPSGGGAPAGGAADGRRPPG